MKKIWNMLKGHVKNDFNPKAYGSLLLLLVVLLTFNYVFDFEDDYVDQVAPVWRIPAKFAWFFVPYSLAALITFPLFGKSHVLKNTVFWLMVVFITIAMAFDSGFPIYKWLLKDNVARPTVNYLFKVLRNLLNVPFVLFPALIVYLLQNERNHFFGVTAKFDLKPYLSLLLIMIPALFFAFQLPELNEFYPMYSPSAADEYWDVKEKWLILIYEFCYGWNFFSVEFIFRGFLVIGMMKIVGKEAILPMVVLYCVYHFGKPMGEAISSIFGGYILGVIAYYTRSIIGGVLLHIGIAFTMEVFGFLL